MDPFFPTDGAPHPCNPGRPARPEVRRLEGAWDYPWDVQPLKIASLKSNLASETDPIKRLITQGELAQQYMYGGASEAGIALPSQQKLRRPSVAGGTRPTALECVAELLS